MNITEIKERYDYDNPNGDFFYESINCADAVQRMKDFSWLIKEIERLNSHSYALSKDNSLLQTEFAIVEADKAKLVDFVNEVKISADRGCLRAKAEKLIRELEGE